MNVISTNDEAESVNLAFDNMVGSKVSSNIEMDDNDQEHLNISADSFDTSQTTDIENDQEQESRKNTTKSKYDVLQFFTQTDNGDFLCILCKEKSKVSANVFCVAFTRLNIFHLLVRIVI